MLTQQVRLVARSALMIATSTDDHQYLCLACLGWLYRHYFMLMGQIAVSGSCHLDI
jgi:hypothetical protein